MRMSFHFPHVYELGHETRQWLQFHLFLSFIVDEWVRNDCVTIKKCWLTNDFESLPIKPEYILAEPGLYVFISI